MNANNIDRVVALQLSLFSTTQAIRKSAMALHDHDTAIGYLSRLVKIQASIQKALLAVDDCPLEGISSFRIKNHDRKALLDLLGTAQCLIEELIVQIDMNH